MGRSGGKEGQVGQEGRSGWYGLVWFGRNCEAEFKTMHESMNEITR